MVPLEAVSKKRQENDQAGPLQLDAQIPSPGGKILKAEQILYQKQMGNELVP
jgi:hypothetical protein